MIEYDSGFYYVPYTPMKIEQSYPPENDDIYCIEFYRFLKCSPMTDVDLPAWLINKINRLIYTGDLKMYHIVENDTYRFRFNDGEYKTKMEEILGFVEL